jgi:hypothetical protein
MRTIIAVLVVTSLVLCIQGAGAQTKRAYTWGDSLTATTTWTKYQRPGFLDRILGFAIDHDGGTGNLLVAFGNDFTSDTTVGRRQVVRPYESLPWFNLSIDAIWVRSTVGTIPFRLRAW